MIWNDHSKEHLIINPGIRINLFILSGQFNNILFTAFNG